jgi:tetratricopeptide (TPR) repeat protein
MKSKLWLWLFLLSLASAFPALAEEGVADARRHLVRGVAAIEMAKNDAELVLAADEFTRAAQLDPNLYAAWYNLGAVQVKLGQFNAAIQSYKHYLSQEPRAEDAQKVEDEIIKLEFRQEQVAKSNARKGTWITDDGTPYLMTIDGNHMTLATDKHRITDDEAESTYTLAGKVPISNLERVAYRLEARGSQLTGTWMHSAVVTEACTLPEENGDVTGELRDAERIIVLRHTRTKFHAHTQMYLFQEDACAEVVPVATREFSTVFSKSPQP